MTTVVQYTRIGGPEVLEVLEVPTPSLPADGALVRVRAAGLNPIDWKLRKGIRGPAELPEPRVPGSDGAGEIIAVGDELEGWNVGDLVILRQVPGTYATEVVAKAENLVREPDNVSFEQGAAVGIPVATAYQSLKSLGLGEGQTLLIHGASGAVGQAAIQFARIWGAKVIGTASEANHPRLRELGAIPVAYGDGLLERLRGVAPGGVDRVLDAAGSDDALRASLALVSDPQHVATIVAGARAAELGIQAYSGGSPYPLTPEQLQYRYDAIPVVAALLAEGRFQVEIGKVFPLVRAAEAQAESEAGGVRGKIILIP